jgi:uncharacterized membrane protein YkoI
MISAMTNMLPRPAALLAFAALSLAPATFGAFPAAAQRDQDAAYRAARTGAIRPLPDILARVNPRMDGADFLGSELDTDSRVYRLKYMRGASVMWVDVDARTGMVLGRSGR